MCIYVRICVHSAKEVYCPFQKDDINILDAEWSHIFCILCMCLYFFVLYVFFNKNSHLLAIQILSVTKYLCINNVCDCVILIIH